LLASPHILLERAPPNFDAARIELELHSIVIVAERAATRSCGARSLRWRVSRMSTSSRAFLPACWRDWRDVSAQASFVPASRRRSSPTATSTRARATHTLSLPRSAATRRSCRAVANSGGGAATAGADTARAEPWHRAANRPHHRPGGLGRRRLLHGAGRMALRGQRARARPDPSGEGVAQGGRPTRRRADHAGQAGRPGHSRPRGARDDVHKSLLMRTGGGLRKAARHTGHIGRRRGPRNEAFVHVADQKSFTRAARILYRGSISRDPISRAAGPLGVLRERFRREEHRARYI
jgi:hypothetical protein